MKAYVSNMQQLDTKVCANQNRYFESEDSTYNSTDIRPSEEPEDRERIKPVHNEPFSPLLSDDFVG